MWNIQAENPQQARKPVSDAGQNKFGHGPVSPICVRVVSRFHVVSLQDRLDRQVAHAGVFGKVALGPELVLQHLGKVSDVLAWRGLKGRPQWRLCSHTNTPFSPGCSHICSSFAFIYTSSEVKWMALLLALSVITGARRRNRFMTLLEFQQLYFILRCVFKEITI